MELSIIDGSEENGNVFVVETKAESGAKLTSHKHSHSHLSVLVSGVAEVDIDGKKTVYSGYNIITVPKDCVHEVKAITDIVWLCIWDSDLAPREEAENALMLVNGNGTETKTAC